MKQWVSALLRNYSATIRRHPPNSGCLVRAQQVEVKQYELMCCLLGNPGAGNPREDALVEFLRYLVQKNREATRDIPPPGLSGERGLAGITAWVPGFSVGPTRAL